MVLTVMLLEYTYASKVIYDPYYMFDSLETAFKRAAINSLEFFNSPFFSHRF